MKGKVTDIITLVYGKISGIKKHAIHKFIFLFL